MRNAKCIDVELIRMTGEVPYDVVFMFMHNTEIMKGHRVACAWLPASMVVIEDLQGRSVYLVSVNSLLPVPEKKNIQRKKKKYIRPCNDKDCYDNLVPFEDGSLNPGDKVGLRNGKKAYIECVRRDMWFVYGSDVVYSYAGLAFLGKRGLFTRCPEFDIIGKWKHVSFCR